MNKIRQILNDILYVSKLTKIQRKKFRILFSAIISNSISFADIVIILTFSSLLTDSEITSNQYLDFITNNPILIVFIVIIRYVLNFLGKYNVYSLTKDIEQSLKVYLLKEVYKKGNYSLADATYYIETLSGHIAYFFNAFTNVMSSFIQVIVFTIFLTYSNLEALSAFGILLIVLYYPTKYLLVKGREAMEDSYKFSQFSARYIQRIIDNLFLVKILNTHEYEVNNFDNNLTNLYRTEKKKFTLQDINASIPNFIAVFSFSLILSLSIAGIKLTLEFIGVTLRLMQSIGGLNSAMSMLVSTHVHLDKLLLVERNRNLESNFSYEVDSESDDAIKLNKVSFSFINSDNNFYEKIDLSFEKNKHHVITGVNGSGKSTLLGILSGALLPFEGSATKNTDKIGYIGASPLILEDTLRANLKYASKDEISDDEMMVLLDEFKVFSENTIDKLDEIITNKTLSSGQMQKVSFIRAFLSNCEILFLDESTANLDVQTKKQISDILSTKEITIINSTHNPEDFVFDKHLKITINNNDKRIIESL